MMKRLLGVSAAIMLMVTLTGCGTPEVNLGEISGFRHETSVRVGFDPETERSVFLSVSNEGTATFITERPEFPGPGPMPPGEQHYIFNLFKVTNDGQKTHLNRSYPRWDMSHDMEYIIATDEDDIVYFIDRSTLEIKEIDDTTVAYLTRPGNHECLSDAYISYRRLPPDNETSWQTIGIYDIRTQKDIVVDLGEPYEFLRGTDFQNNRVLIQAFNKNDWSEPPVYYIVTSEGAILAEIPTDYYGTSRHFEAILAQGGLAVFSSSHESILKLRKYDYDGNLLWSQNLPAKGNPTLKRIQDGDRELLALTTWKNDVWYAGYFVSDNGTPLYKITFDDTRQIELTDKSGTFYLFKEWGDYHDEAAPTARISLYEQGAETAFVDIVDGIYYFANSPDGNYFAVLTGETASIFSRNAGNGPANS